MHKFKYNQTLIQIPNTKKPKREIEKDKLVELQIQGFKVKQLKSIWKKDSILKEKENTTQLIHQQDMQY